MKKIYSAIAVLLAAPAAFGQALPQTGSGETDGYRLVWQELFDGEELNPLRWDIEVNGAGGGNNELQYYTDRPENVRLGDDGRGNRCLILTARREEYNGKHFTSGRINSKNRIAFTHGKLEASIMLPKTANGLWPAFWTMGNDYDEVGWPKCGETDILEMGNATGISNGSQEFYFNGAQHWGQGWPNASNAKATTFRYSLQDGEYHLFTMIWDENEVKMYVDYDKYPKYNPYYSMKCPATEPDNEWNPGNYFHKDNFILFNLAVGGNFPGLHKAEEITALNDGNGQQASMYVNYVRIYQKGDSTEHTDFLDAGDAPDASVADIAGETQRIDYDGNSLSSKSPITLFTPDGRTVAISKAGVIDTTSLSKGIYLANSNGATRKIVVR